MRPSALLFFTLLLAPLVGLRATAGAATAAEISFELRSAAAPDGPAIRIAVSGRRLEPPVEIDASVGASGAAMGPEVEFLRNLVRANASGRKEDLVALFRPGERAATEAAAAEPGLLERNAATYRAFIGSRWVAEISYGPVTYLVVEHDLDDGRRLVQFYPTTTESGVRYLSNVLKDDPHVEILRQAFAERQILAIPSAPQTAVPGSTKP